MRRPLSAAGGSRAWRRLVAACLARDGYICRLTRDGHPCGAPATTADHVIPRAYGGADRLDNLQAACIPCNLRKGARLRGHGGAALVARHNAVIAIVARLDAAGVPVDAGRRGAALALATGHPWRSTDIDAACRYRRHRGPLTRV
jgi:5-methylcytosine-specific restriction endonuclease McrA